MLKYGLALKASGHIDSLVEKSVEAEKIGFDYLWIFDRPSNLYSPIVASAIVSKTSKMKIGLGFTPLLHTSNQISGILNTLMKRFGERFELCLFPGDKLHLNRVGITFMERSYPEVMLQAKNQIRLSLDKENFQCKTLLGAQGLG